MLAKDRGVASVELDLKYRIIGTDLSCANLPTHPVTVAFCCAVERWYVHTLVHLANLCGS